VNPYQADGFNEFPPRTLILELARQLYAWREHLPTALNWNDENPDIGIEVPTTPGAWQQTVLGEPSGPTLLDTKVVLHASLRTRYKYAQYLIWRPYIYKMLHFSNLSTDEDLHGCGEAIKVCSSTSG
jgi:hypothetical protein